MGKFSNISRKPTERISQTVFYVIIGLIAVTFALFYLVGYNTQSVEDPSFVSPMLTDVILVLMIVLLAAAAVVKISTITFGVTFAVLLLTFIFGSTDSMMINGHQFTDVVSLKLTDMFVATSIVMIVLAIGAMVFGYTRYIRKEK